MPKLGLKDYVAEILFSIEHSEQEIKKISKEVKDAKRRGANVWILGNGGSLAIAQHFAQDLLKMRNVRAQCLNDASVITAYTNDEGFEQCFYEPLMRLARNGDLVIAFSCSGKSRNYDRIFSKSTVENTLPWLHRIAVVGTDGGTMKEKADICVHIKNDDYKICETAFNIVADLVNIELEEKSA